jgi:hypothetical protein
MRLTSNASIFRACALAQSAAMALVLGASGAQSQTPALNVPADKFADYCYFNGGIYSPGAFFCVKPGTSIICTSRETAVPSNFPGGTAHANWPAGVRSGAYWDPVPDTACTVPQPAPH